jgi:hypothetical protein
MKKQPNKWLIFSSLAFQIAIIMYGAIQLGTYLDRTYTLPNKLATLLLSGFGLLTILWLIYRQSKKFWDNE